MRPRIAIILPTLNEEKGLGKVLDELQALSKGQWKMVVVDGGSTDRTLDIAKEKKATIMAIPVRGKGRALKEVFKKIDSDYLIVMDADATYPPQEIPKILRTLKECDVVIGSRFKGKIARNAMSKINKLGNRCLTLLGNLLYGKGVSDMCSGMWGFRRNVYKEMEIKAPHFELEANFFTEAAKHGFKICEVPISYEKREGEAKLRISDGVSIGCFLIKNRF